MDFRVKSLKFHDLRLLCGDLTTRGWCMICFREICGEQKVGRHYIQTFFPCHGLAMVLYKSAISLFFDSLHQLFIGEHALQCQPQSLIWQKNRLKNLARTPAATKNRLLIMMETFLPLQRVKTKAAQIVAVCICSSTHQWCDTSSKHCPGNGTMAHSHTRPAPGILKIQSSGVALRKLRRWLAHIKTGNKHSQGVSNVCCSIWGDRHIFKHLLLSPESHICPSLSMDAKDQIKGNCCEANVPIVSVASVPWLWAILPATVTWKGRLITSQNEKLSLKSYSSMFE